MDLLEQGDDLLLREATVLPSAQLPESTQSVRYAVSAVWKPAAWLDLVRVRRCLGSTAPSRTIRLTLVGNSAAYVAPR